MIVSVKHSATRALAVFVFNLDCMIREKKACASANASVTLFKALKMHADKAVYASIISNPDIVACPHMDR